MDLSLLWISLLVLLDLAEGTLSKTDKKKERLKEVISLSPSLYLSLSPSVSLSLLINQYLIIHLSLSLFLSVVMFVNT